MELKGLDYFNIQIMYVHINIKKIKILKKERGFLINKIS